MSKIADRVGSRYDEISDYFKDHSLGKIPEDLTVLSLLPPIDRCLILERVIRSCKCDFTVCIDKLSMAYYKAGMDRVAFEFLERCEAADMLDGSYGSFIDKLKSLNVHNVSQSYLDTLAKFPAYDSGSRFCKLIRALCLRYRNNNIITGKESELELVGFINERRAFIHDFTKDRSIQCKPPKEGSGDEWAYLLANSQLIAFSYLIGGGRIENVRFVTSDTIGVMDEETKLVWRKTADEVRRFSSYPYGARRDSGERGYLVSVEFACYCDWSYQYRTSHQRISVDDVVDLMYEVMDVKPRVTKFERSDGEKIVRFSWIFLQDDVDDLLRIFRSVVCEYGAWIQMGQVFGDMDMILNRIAQKALDVYPFMRCEFTGW